MSNSIGNVSGLANALSQSTDTSADQVNDFSSKLNESSGNTYGMDPGQFADSLNTGGQGSGESWNSPNLTAKFNADMKSGNMEAVNQDMEEQKQDFNAQSGSGSTNTYGMDPGQFADSLNTSGQGSGESWNSPNLTAKFNADMKSGNMEAVNQDMEEQKQDFK
jgi:hypothetical protein